MAKVLVEAFQTEIKYYISNRVDPLTTKRQINKVAPNRVFNNNNSDFEEGCWFDDELPIQNLFDLCNANGWAISTGGYVPMPELATQRQISYIIDLGGEVESDLPKNDASNIISKLLEVKNEIE